MQRTLALCTWLAASQCFAASVVTHVDVDCIDVAALTQRLTACFAGASPDLGVQVEAHPEGERVRVGLGITLANEDIFARSYSVATADCKSAEDLLVTVAESFVAAPPVDLSPGDKPVPVPPSAWRVAPRLGVVGTETGAAHLEVGGDVVALPQGLAVGTRLRLMWPRTLGSGRLVAATAMLAAGPTGELAAWQWTAQVRSGLLALGGRGYHRDHRVVRPWLELDAEIGRRLAGIDVGGELGFAPFSYRAATSEDSQVGLGQWFFGIFVGGSFAL